MMRLPKLGQLALALSATLFSFTAKAYDIPALNLGFTSFLDGGPPAGPGFYFQEYLHYYSAGTLKGANGQKLNGKPGFTNPDLDAWVSLSQFIVQCPKKMVLGGQPGINLIVPLVDIGISGTPMTANKGGLGDINIGPFLQWEPIMGKNGPIFMHRVELTTIVPSGRYSDRYTLNPGANIYSFNPYWSGTLFVTPKLTLSTRAHYLWNSKNNDPWIYGAPTMNDSIQPGQAVHVNFATEYELIEKKLRVGLNGYYLKQISNSKYNGVSTPGTREEVLGIGPGALFSINQNNHLFFNSYFETAVDNRPEGMRFILRYVHHF